jgi:hypothetical protein
MAEPHRKKKKEKRGRVYIVSRDNASSHTLKLKAFEKEKRKGRWCS